MFSHPFFLHSQRKLHQRLTWAQVCVGEVSPGADVYIAVSRARVVLLKTEEPHCLHHSIARAWWHLSRVKQVLKRCLVKRREGRTEGGIRIGESPEAGSCS